MKLGEVLNKLSNSDFLLTITGICEEWDGGAEEIKEEPYYRAYKNRTVESMAILLTNGMPELCISLKEG